MMGYYRLNYNNSEREEGDGKGEGGRKDKGEKERRMWMKEKGGSFRR